MSKHGNSLVIIVHFCRSALRKSTKNRMETIMKKNKGREISLEMVVSDQIGRKFIYFRLPAFSVLAIQNSTTENSGFAAFQSIRKKLKCIKGITFLGFYRVQHAENERM